jgi:hypothetical protein
MKPTRPELGLERVLAALEQDLLLAADEEILDVAYEMGLKPDMRGSIALAGVTFTAQVNFPLKATKKARPAKRAGQRKSREPGEQLGNTDGADTSKGERKGAVAPRSRRRPKDDVP